MTAMRLIMIAEPAKAFMLGLPRKDRTKLHEIIYSHLSRTHRPFKEEDGIVRVEGDNFKLITPKYRIYFTVYEKDLLWIADIRANGIN